MAKSKKSKPKKQLPSSAGAIPVGKIVKLEPLPEKKGGHGKGKTTTLVPQKLTKDRAPGEQKLQARQGRGGIGKSRISNKAVLSGLPKDYPVDTHVPNQTELSLHLNMSVHTVRRYIILGMPYDKWGYNVEECRKWILDYRAAAASKSNTKGTAVPDADKQKKFDLINRKVRAETRKLIQEARGKKLKNDEHEGLLLPADDVRQWVASRFLRIKQRLELLPDELQMLAPASIRSQLRLDLSSAIYELLLEMSSWETKTETDTFIKDSSV